MMMEAKVGGFESLSISACRGLPLSRRLAPAPAPAPVASWRWRRASLSIRAVEKSVPNSNYVVPLDNPPASSCITRPLVEILRDLNKRVPDKVIKGDGAVESKYIPWYHANRMLSFYAPVGLVQVGVENSVMFYSLLMGELCLWYIESLLGDLMERHIGSHQELYP